MVLRDTKKKPAQTEMDDLVDDARTSTVAPKLSRDTDPTARWVLVTPSMAKRWTSDDVNSRNRDARDAVIKSYAEDMRTGNWLINGGTIVFSDDGTLLDGQHRLKAVALAGVPIKFLVVGNIDTGAQATMDRGLKRTDADDIRINAETEEDGKYATQRAAWVQAIHLIGTGHAERLGFGQKEAIKEKFARALEWGRSHMLHQPGLKTAPIMGALVFAYQVAPREVAAFVERVRTGADLSRGDPALALRNYALRLASVRQNPLDVSNKTLRCVHAAMRGEKLEELKVSASVLAFFRKRTGFAQ